MVVTLLTKVLYPGSSGPTWETEMKRLVSVVVAGAIALALAGTGVQPAQAEPPDDDTISNSSLGEATGPTELSLQPFRIGPNLTIPNVVFDSEAELGRLPGVTTGIYVQQSPIRGSVVSPMTYGKGYVIGRARAWMTASNGWVRKGYTQGTLSAVGAVALAFVPGVAAMTIATILSVVSIVASSSNTVKGETLVTYRYLYRDGEGRWSSDPNASGYWHLGYRTGRLETYKAVTGGRLNPVTKIWTITTKNYNSSPATATNTPNYGQSNSWLAKKGASYVTASVMYSETSW